MPSSDEENLKALCEHGIKADDILRRAGHLNETAGISMADAIHVAITQMTEEISEANSMAKSNTPKGQNFASTFVAIAQPNYFWSEKFSKKKDGVTTLPLTEGDLEAEITVPGGGPVAVTPEGRFVRIHEMLHARHTPDIQHVAHGPDGKALSAMALQLAEDVRLHALGHKAGVFTDDVYVEDAFFQDLRNRKAQSPRHEQLHLARVFMGIHGAPVEGGWDTKNVDTFAEKILLHSGKPVARRTKRLLKAWARMADSAMQEPETPKSFLPLAQKSDKLMRLLMKARANAPSMPMPGEPKTGAAGGGGGAGERSDGKSGAQENDKPEQQPLNPDKDAQSRERTMSELEKALSDVEKYKKEHNDAREKEGELIREFKTTRSDDRRVEVQSELNHNVRRAKERAYNLHAAAKADVDRLKKLMEDSAQNYPMADFGKGSKVEQWVPAAFDDQAMAQMKGRAAAVKARWKPSPIEHKSNYKPWDGPPPPEADPKDYSLDPKSKGWGRMITRLAPLQRNFKARVKRHGAASPEGPLPKFFNRWFGDKDVFERKGRRLGGTLLLDVSGSMSWSHDKTLRLIEQTPAMTIAAYSSDASDGGAGRLTIIAQHGRLVSPDFVLHNNVGELGGGHGGGNVVDGPALAWLARQPKPRVWFSDGQVTGAHETSGMGIYEDSRRLQRLGAILRTTDVPSVIKIFSGQPFAVDSRSQSEDVCNAGDGENIDTPILIHSK